MFYPDHVLREVIDNNSIEGVISSYVQLKKSNGRYIGICPFHAEKTPSFTVTPQKGLYYCFGCHEGGNVVTFLQKQENMSFIEAVEFLAKRIDYALPNSSVDQNNLKEKKQLIEIHILAAKFFYQRLQQEEKAINYLKMRKVSPQICKKFGIGYAPKNGGLTKALKDAKFSDEILVKSGLFVQTKNGILERFYNRIMFPIFNFTGELIAFGGRDIEGTAQAKYLNSPETIIFNKSRNLYGINFAKKSKNKELILVEGYLDVVALHQFGFDNVVAALGTSFNKNHANTIKRLSHDVTLLFDNDNAGTKATLNAINVLTNSDINVKVCTINEAKDPDEYLHKYGKISFSEKLEQSTNYVLYQVENIMKQKDGTIETDIKIYKQITSILKDLSEIEKDVYIKKISEKYDIPKSAILKEAQDIVNNATTKIKKKPNIKIKGIEKAKENILFYACNDAEILNKIKSILDPEELDDKIYEKIMTKLYESGETNFNLLINDIEDEKERQKLVEKYYSFQISPEISNKIIADSLQTIWRSYIENCKSDLTDKNFAKLSLIKQKIDNHKF